MSRIGDSQPSQIWGIHGVQGGKTTPANEAAQMKYILEILSAIIQFQPEFHEAKNFQQLSDKLHEAHQLFDEEMKKNPPDLNKLQDELNGLIDQYNTANKAQNFPHWSLSEDQSKTGYSFMECLLSFSQYLDGESGQNKNVHDYVAKIGNFIAAGNWDPKSLEGIVTDFLHAADSLGPNPNGRTFPSLPVPPNFFE